MADTYEQNLGQKASLTTNDFIRVVGSDNVSYKQRVDKVMGDIGVYTWTYGYTNPQVSAFSELKNSGFYTIGDASSYSDAPVITYGFLAVFHGGSYAIQTYYALGIATRPIYHRYSTNNGTSWSAWVQEPIDAEVMHQDINWRRGANLNDFMTTGVYWIADAPTNAPSSSWGWFGLAVMGRGDTTRQIAINTEGVVCVRVYQGAQGWREWIQQPTRAEIDALNSKTAVSVTAGANVVIDENKSYKCGRVVFFNVKGHTTANISNATLFSFPGITLNPESFTFGIPIGDSAWTINGIAYGYIGSTAAIGRIDNGKYFHISQAFLCS